METKKIDYKILGNNDTITIKDIRDFNPKHIFECGQAFRWYVEEDGSYTAIHKGKIVNVKKEGKDLILSNTNKSEFNTIWYPYFDLGRDYGEIKKELSKDPILGEAIKFGSGIRILNQDPFETTISFIISANNQIPRIKKSIELISQNYGEFIGQYRGRKYYSFPEAEVLAKIEEGRLEESSKVGYRAKYIVNTSKIIVDKNINLSELALLPTEIAQKNLMDFPGVGPKVSSCILLFSLNKNEAFPVDVWVKRIMEDFYFKEGASNKKISDYAEKTFGLLGGFAQQYLFYYARELGIGKKGV